MKGFVLVMFIGLLLSGSMFGTVIHVPGGYATIQLGLNAATTGDTVLVASGTYTENLFWPLVNGIKLFSVSGASSTVIDGGSTSSVIYFSGMATIDITTVIKGFTIQNGGAIDYGGGICLVNSSPRIENNIIKDNSVNQNGGGICCSDTSSPLISGNTIQGDSAFNHGGGIYCENLSNPTITNNTITGNSADYNGGGISCNYNSNPTITGNTIIGNTADYGGGIYCSDNSSFPITGNTITGNSADCGGGIYCSESDPTIIGNTITSNSAHCGGGIYCSVSNSIITSNTIDSDTAVVGGGIYCNNSDAAITYNIITDNSVSSSGGGIYCSHSDATITFNTITTNSADCGGGIYCNHYSNSTITYNKIINNLSSFHGGGISCNNYSNPHINFNTIKENNADSLGDGIYCEQNSFPVVDSNNIYNNGYGIYNADNSQMLMAEYNWWGHSSGPYHPGLNPGGLGDSTNMFVDPVPFLNDSLVGITEEVKRQEPSVSMVMQNYPNPFKQETFIHYSCIEPSKVTVKVYNLLGQEVAILINNVENAGNHIVRWDARELSNGIYFYRVTIDDFTETRKCMIVR